MFREFVDLALVEVGDRLDVGRTVAVFHEEPLVVFEPIRGSDHGVIQAVRMEIFQRLPDPLLEVGGGDDLEVRGGGKSLLHPFALGILDHHLEKVDPVRIEKVLGDHDFIFPAITVIGKDGADRVVPPLVTADRFQGGRDVLYFIRDAEVLAELHPEFFAFRGGVALREEEREHLPLSHGKGRESRADGAVDPAGNGDDATSPQQGCRHDLAHFLRNTFRGFRQVDAEPGVKGHFISSTRMIDNIDFPFVSEFHYTTSDPPEHARN